MTCRWFSSCARTTRIRTTPPNTTSLSRRSGVRPNLNLIAVGIAEVENVPAPVRDAGTEIDPQSGLARLPSPLIHGLPRRLLKSEVDVVWRSDAIRAKENELRRSRVELGDAIAAAVRESEEVPIERA